jgi:hypothetical protein
VVENRAVKILHDGKITQAHLSSGREGSADGAALLVVHGREYRPEEIGKVTVVEAARQEVEEILRAGYDFRLAASTANTRGGEVSRKRPHPGLAMLGFMAALSGGSFMGMGLEALGTGAGEGMLILGGIVFVVAMILAILARVY